MKSLLLSTAAVALGFALSGCGATMQAFSANSGGQGVDVQAQYEIASLAVDSAKAGNPLSIGDVSGLSDDEIIEKLIDFLEGNLERMKEHIEEAKAAGRKLPENIDTMMERLEQHTDELIERLQTDQAFRAAAAERIRQAQTQTPADSERIVKVPDFELTEEMCKSAAQQLASGKLPEAIRGSLQAHYDRDCK